MKTQVLLSFVPILFELTGVLPAVPHVYNAPEAALHEYPWMVTLFSTYSFCGSSLVRVHKNLQRSDVLLTAAHCVTFSYDCDKNEENCKWSKYPGENMTAIAGNHIFWKKESDEEIRNGRVVVPHPCWNADKPECKTNPDRVWFADDIALVILKEPLNFNDAIKPLDLPQLGDKVENPKTCRLAGWGDHKYKGFNDTKAPSDVLRSISVSLMDESGKALCAKAYHFQPQGLSKFLCAKTEGRNATACQGDSGGPIWCTTNEKKEKVFGVVSANNGYCGGLLPALFTDVAKYADWVHENIQRYSAVAKMEER